ncbi:hypothetical protein [Halalkalicoccus tibetensis]|uniref:Uncharacterized protein n=1 Tax=Halalkalicoccus tibetensis TaxID=175632 RepID=A0ABD5V5S1_9EURY
MSEDRRPDVIVHDNLRVVLIGLDTSVLSDLLDHRLSAINGILTEADREFLRNSEDSIKESDLLRFNTYGDCAPSEHSCGVYKARCENRKPSLKKRAANVVSE